jgi:hypothetical protein
MIVTAEEVKADLLPALRAIRVHRAKELAAAAEKAAREAGLTATVVLASSRELSVEALCERIGRETAELRLAEQQRFVASPAGRGGVADWHREQRRSHEEAEAWLLRGRDE